MLTAPGRPFCRAATSTLLTDCHGPVGDVCARRAGDQEVAQLLEEGFGVVPRESTAGVEAAPARPEKRLPVGQRAGGPRAAVDAVGAGSNDGDSDLAVERERRAEREFEVSTSAAMAAREPDRRFAAGEQHLPRREPRGRARKPLPCLARLSRESSRKEARPQA